RGGRFQPQDSGPSTTTESRPRSFRQSCCFQDPVRTAPSSAPPGTNAFRKRDDGVSPRFRREAPELTFPHGLDVPAQVRQRAGDSTVTGSICVDLRLPELRAGLRQPEQMAIMLVPEASMHKHDRVEPGKNDVRPPWQPGAPKSIPESQGMEALADLLFDLRILAPDPRHQRGTALRADDVGHQAALRLRLAGAAIRASRCGTMIRATSAIIGTTTEFPNCLYARVSETGIRKSSSKPMSRAHSLGVSRRGFFPRPRDTRISDPSL